MSNQEDRLLAKSSGETLAEHTVKAVQVGRALVSSLPFPPKQRRWIASLLEPVLLFHDLGKAAVGFQAVLRGKAERWGFRHEAISAALAAYFDASQETLMAILLHHKNLPPGFIPDERRALQWEQIYDSEDPGGAWHYMWIQWEENIRSFKVEWEEICRSLGRNRWTKTVPMIARPYGLGYAWLDRDKDGQCAKIPFASRHTAALLRGLTMAADHLSSAGHLHPPSPIALKRYKVTSHKLRPFQQQCRRTLGNAILRAPTGSGKTEAALLWGQANQMVNSRLFYVLPYTASINAMYQRLSSIFCGQNSQNVGLLHSRSASALYRLMVDEEDIPAQRQLRARALADLAHEMWFPIRVCTPHQILRYSLRGKGWETMLAEFPNACFIMDEIHAYDPRVVGLTLATVKLLKSWGARFLFVSATLPRFLASLICESLSEELPEIIPDPRKSRDAEIIGRKRHRLRLVPGNVLDWLDAIIERARIGQKVLVVCNHVRSAQELYERLKERLSGLPQPMLLHGRFNSRDRCRKEDFSCGLPAILVATQVVEVSLDIDFDCGFFEPAPMDALVQRMGRVNRKGERPPAEIFILQKQLNSHELYDDDRVQATLEQLGWVEKAKGGLLGEIDLVIATNEVYRSGYQGKELDSFNAGLNHPGLMNFEAVLQVGTHEEWVKSVVESTDGTIEVLPKTLEQTYKDLMKKKLWLEASMLLVPVRKRHGSNFWSYVVRWHDDVPVLEWPYDEEMGLRVPK